VPAGRFSQVLLGFLRVIIIAIVCLAPSSAVKSPRHAAYDGTLEERRAGNYRSSRKKENTLYFVNHVRGITDALCLLVWVRRCHWTLFMCNERRT